MLDTAVQKRNTIPIDVIVWAREVEVRGLPPALQTEFEQRGAFWATRGLRMTDRLFGQLETEHPELLFSKLEVKKPESHDCEHDHD